MSGVNGKRQVLLHIFQPKSEIMENFRVYALMCFVYCTAFLFATGSVGNSDTVTKVQGLYIETEFPDGDRLLLRESGRPLLPPTEDEHARLRS